MESYPNVLVIRGESRNSGKTLLACNILAKFGRDRDIIGLKISYHYHHDIGHAKKIYSEGDTEIYEETDFSSSKDTGRMLAAGAAKTYLLQTTDAEIMPAIDTFLSLVGKNALIICESGKILTHSNVGISLFVRQLNCQVCSVDIKSPGKNTDRIVTYTTNGFDLDLNTIKITPDGWTLNEK